MRTMSPRAWLAAVGVVLSVAASSQAGDANERRVVDLTHPFDSETLYWPTAPARFAWEKLAWGKTEAGWFYAAGAFSSPEHGGTHLDAPVHFAEGRRAVDAIPVEQLVAPAVVIDASAQAAKDPGYQLTREDVLAFEAAHGRIEAGTVVLLRTGWDRFWPDAKAYLGDDTPGDASRLRFPSFGTEAAKLLVEERGILGLGVDTASIDPGAAKDFPVHRIAAARNVYGLENLRDLDQLPPRGTLLVALPMKIAGGSGAPVRVIGLLPAR